MKSCEPLLPPPSISFLLVGLLSGLGGLALNYLWGGRLDDSDSHSLPHVTDSEPFERIVKICIRVMKANSLPSERREICEGLDTHGLAGGQPHDSGVTRFDELGVVLNRLAGTTVNLLLDLGELKTKTLDLKHWSVSVISDKKAPLTQLSHLALQ